MTRPRPEVRWSGLLNWLCIALLSVGAVNAQEDDDEFPQYKPGLIAHYTDAQGHTCERRDAALNLVWNGQSPDPRLAAGPFQARWQGRLFTIEPGAYRLHLFAAGRVQVRLNNQLVLNAESRAPGWLEADPVNLTYGYHPLEIEFEKLDDRARLGLFWEGPRFQVEPAPERHLFHDPQIQVDDRFERGKRLTRALRCQACHTLPGETDRLPAPSLVSLRSNVSRNWLVKWLQTAPHAKAHGEEIPDERTGGQPSDELSRRMPAFEFDRVQAEAVADYLLSQSKRDEAPTPKPAESKPLPQGDAAAGAKLFRTTGCLACHRAGELGQPSLFGGGDLSHIADKRPASFFATWLNEPSRINSAHRMPVFSLSPQETADLSAYLAGLKQNTASLPAGEPLEPPQADRQSLALGRDLVVRARCAACHSFSESEGKSLTVAPLASKTLSASSDWAQSCLNAPRAEKQQPGFQLAASQAKAIRTYISEFLAEPSGAPPYDGQFVLEERNCSGCHVRGYSPGIAAQLPAVVAADPDLAQELPLLTAPALLGVGDKLHEEALRAAIATLHKPRRPWLSIRMPKFNLGDDEMKALVRHFVDSDRIPELPKVTSAGKLPAKKELIATGGRLLTSDGFGCTSCHQIGNWTPQKVALNARGTDLSDLGDRIRLPWYDRWVRNPARIVPRMEMPSIVAPVRNVLHENLDQQLSAVWRVLNEPGFNPPAPSAIRVVRTSNMPALKEPAAVLTDVLEVGKQVFIRPLIVGLPNRQNVFFDLETNRLTGWWIGDTALQRTRGKSWYWEPNAAPLFPLATEGADVRLLIAGELSDPQVSGQLVGEFDWLEQIDGGVRFGQRLRFADPSSGDQSRMLSVVQSLTAIWPASIDGKPAASGFRRRIEVKGLPSHASLVFSAFPGDGLTIATDGRTAARDDVPGNCRIEIRSPQNARFDSKSKAGVVVLSAGEPGSTVSYEVDYTTDLPVDQVLQTPDRPALAAEPRNVVPGYEGKQLPLSDAEMPISLAWREDGSLIVCSLKGRVCLARDTDGDGLEDQITPFSDELAAPYGAAAHDGAIDVIAKYGLLRLHDRNGDGRAERTEVLASGWGYTTDYHDWAVGLERDEEGNYYIALPCQQDNRSPAAAHLRGQGLKLSPKEPSASDPHRYTIESFCGGLRFPMGLARSRHGALFATDNQGNYNPFNELNHLTPGARYGFINKLEVRPNFHPPLTPPAIDIPHPWTRSVNGIAFLDTPAALRKQTGRDVFGLHEGHLIGCEYDSRQLVRMSLEQIDGVYQGAVYPFTTPLSQDEPPLQGPISCAVSPQGDLYIGNIRDSGWGGGANVGSIVRLRPRGELPAGIAEVRATSTGFTIDFTAAVDAGLAAQATSYAVTSYRRISTPAYGGPDVDRKTANIERIDVSPDARRVTLTLDRLRAGFVYEIRLINLAGEGEPFHPAEAHYTLRKIPR